MGKNLDGILKAVCGEDTFVTFIAALAADRAEEVQKEKNDSSPYGPGANGWESSTIEAFLESASAWATDWKDSPQFRIADNPWQRCAQIIYAGKSYE